MQRLIALRRAALPDGITRLSVLLAAGLVLLATFAGAFAAAQGVRSLAVNATAYRLEKAQQAFEYLTRQRGADLSTLVGWLSTQPEVIAFGAGQRPAAPDLLPSAVALGGADFVAVRSRDGGWQVTPAGFASATEGLPPSDPASSFSGLALSPSGALQWLAVAPLPDGGAVAAGFLLGDAFADQFHAWTGMELIIFNPTAAIATSLSRPAGGRLPPQAVPGIEQSESGGAVSLTAGGDSYQARYIKLYDPRGAAVGGYLAALPVADATREQAQLIRDVLPFLGIVLLVAIVSTVFVTRRARAPLTRLRAALLRLAEGDFAAPVESDEVAVALVGDLEEVHRRLHAALRELAIEKSLYKGIFHSMGSPVFTTDATGRVTSYNPAAGALFLEEPERPEPACWGATCLPDSQGRSLCDRACVWLWMSGVAEPTVVKTRLRPESTDPRDLEITVAPIKDGDNKTVGLVHLVRDISLEEELLRLKERFLMSVAHELRTPLSSLSASVELLEDDFDTLAPAARGRLLATVRRGVLRLTTLVSNLLDLGSIQAGRFSVKPQPIRIDGPLRDAIAITEASLEPRGQRVELALPSPPPVVQGDASRVCQVLVNLISNAGKYGVEGDTISITVEERRAHVYIAVTDHGPGIAPVERQRLFEYYFRATGATQRAEGFGLGLAILKGIIDAHGGEVGVESEPGRGSTFWFTLPLAEEPVAAGLGPAVRLAEA